MSTKTRKPLGDLIQHIATLAAGEAVGITLDSNVQESVSVQVSVAAGDTATVHGSCEDAADVSDVAAQAFPLFGETGAVPAGAARTVLCPFPSPLRTVFVSAGGDNVGAVRVVVLQ